MVGGNREKPVPSLTVDALIVDGEEILLVKRLNPPYRGLWALPGGFVDYGETVEAAVVRESKEETGLKVDVIRLCGVYSQPDRDPRGHTVSVVFLCEICGGKLQASSDAAEAGWFRLDELPELAFDHRQIIADYLNTVKTK
ncbi:MAG: ADP-ribose pyrophosphatase [Candidatus Altiarchaeales archaeon ex4484_96]|nr:MAG: ADP-ribose pyrophosphatase [Candidatus Altiarchaeales archaeon ex4484_96]